ncbi:MAG: hypothetical protein ACR2PG_14350, partial [Hyphomicrobiaceae bacterium]
MITYSRTTQRRSRGAFFGLIGCTIVSFALIAPASASGLLDEAVEFTGTVLFLQSKVPALLIGAVRNGETSIHG